MLPPPRAKRRVASLAAHDCGCERFRGTSTTPSSTAEAIEQRVGINSATQALVMDTRPPTTTYVRESYQAFRSHDGPERCQVSPPLATPSTRWCKQRRQQRPDYHIVYAAQLSSSVCSARRTTASSRSGSTPANGRAHPTQSPMVASWAGVRRRRFFANATNHAPPLPRLKRRETSLATCKCGCKR